MSAAPCEKAIPGLFSYGSTPALRMAAVALWWRSVINIAAVSRSTMPSLLASICSRADVSMAMAVLDGPDMGLGLGPARRFTSLWRGMPPSLACTVRSWRSKRSRRTKVLLHFMHLKGRSLVSATSCQHCSMVSRCYVGLDARPQISPARDPGEKEGKLGRNNKLTGSLMSAAMLAPRKSPVAELALVLLLGQR